MKENIKKIDFVKHYCNPLTKLIGLENVAYDVNFRPSYSVSLKNFQLHFQRHYEMVFVYDSKHDISKVWVHSAGIFGDILDKYHGTMNNFGSEYTFKGKVFDPDHEQIQKLMTKLYWEEEAVDREVYRKNQAQDEAC